MKKETAGNIRGHLSDGTPNPIDKQVGLRIRLRRSILGLSQEKLAEELGITFQQVQKYEKGLNRVGASRLWDLSQVLGVSVDFFYLDLDESARNKSPRKITGYFELSDIEAEANSYKADLLSRRDIADLIRYYDSIKDPKISKSILNLIRSLSKVPDSEIDI